MSNGKANTKKSLVDEIIKLKRQNVKSYGQQRQKVSSGSYIGSSGQKGGADSNINPAFELKTSGDTMVGPIAFYPRLQFITSPSTTLDISKSTGTAYSSRVIVSGSSNAATVSTISGAAHAGQIIFLQAASAQTITINETGNISIPGSTSSYVMTANEIILLQYDTTTTKWITVNLGSGGGSSSLLTSNNTWTGTNTFTGGTFTSAASISTSITSPVIYIGDQASDVVNITGAISSTATNVWSGINTFSSSVSFTGATTTIGDNVNDVFTLYGKMGSDINMSTYDITSIDRLKFSTTAGSGSALGSTDTGIEALFNSGSPYGMIIQFPSTNSAVMQIKRGSTDMINISSLGVLFGDELLMGGHKISNLGTPTATTDAATKAYVDASSGGSGAPLNGNNIWTGTNSFNGSYVTVSGTFSASGAAFTIGNASSDQLYINSTMQSDLDMGDNDLTDVQSVRFGAVGLSPLNGTLWYDGSNLKGKSSSGGTFTIDGSGGGGGPTLTSTNTWTGVNTFTSTTSFSVTSPNIYIGDQATDDIDITGEVSIQGGDLTVHNNLQVYNDVVINDALTVHDSGTLGSSSSDTVEVNGDINLNSDVNFTNNTGTASYNFYTLLSQGYITIKINGSSKRLYYFAG